MDPTTPIRRRVTDHAMAAAVLLSLSVHAAGFLVLTVPGARKGPTTDVVGDAPELTLGLDIPAPPAPTPPPTPIPTPQPDPTPEPVAEPPAPEPAPIPQPAPAPTPPARRPDQFAQRPVDRVLEAPKPVVQRPSAPKPAAPRPAPAPAAPPPPPGPPVAAFAGVKAEQARTVVYAVDISGVMVDSLPFVLAEVQRCVARLTPEQRFQVVLFSDPTPPPSATDDPSAEHNPVFDGERAASGVDLPKLEDLWANARCLGETPAGLRDVGEASRAELTGLLTGVKTTGVSNPLTGLRLALSMKPDVVFLLTRGIKRKGTPWGPSEAATMAALDEANPKDGKGRRATTIRTVQFVSADPSGLLDKIAKEHQGGSCTVLTVADLKKAAPAGR